MVIMRAYGNEVNKLSAKGLLKPVYVNGASSEL